MADSTVFYLDEVVCKDGCSIPWWMVDRSHMEKAGRVTPWTREQYLQKGREFWTDRFLRDDEARLRCGSALQNFTMEDVEDLAQGYAEAKADEVLYHCGFRAPKPTSHVRFIDVKAMPDPANADDWQEDDPEILEMHEVIRATPEAERWKLPYSPEIIQDAMSTAPDPVKIEAQRLAFDAVLSGAKAAEAVTPHDDSKLPALKSMTELLATTFKPIRWVIPGLLPEGLAILSGPPKIGKSWMVMNLCIAMATGGYAFGKFPLDRAEVILLSLEDNERRLQDRSKKCLREGSLNLDRLHATTTWRRLDKGGLDDLEGWLNRLPGCSLVVIDTIQKIKPPSRKNSTAYEADYDIYGGLQRMALQYRCCILLIHHNRKSDSKNTDDPLEQISGSTGTTGSMDTILMLRRPRGAAGAVLTATGRDIAESEYAMVFDGPTGQWIVSGQAGEAAIQDNSNASMILDLLKDRQGEEFTVQDVFEAMEERIKWDTVKRELYRLAGKSVVTNHRGKFSYHAPICTVSPVSLVTQ